MQPVVVHLDWKGGEESIGANHVSLLSDLCIKCYGVKIRMPDGGPTRGQYRNVCLVYTASCPAWISCHSFSHTSSDQKSFDINELLPCHRATSVSALA